MMTLDMTQFNATLKEYLAAVPGDLEQLLNKKMFFVLLGAYQRTPKADRSKIEQSLGVAGFRVSIVKKTGRWKKRSAFFDNKTQAVYKIINAARRRKGLRGLSNNDMKKAASALARTRAGASGTAKRGWLKGLNLFGSASRSAAPSEPGPRPRGGGGGKAAAAGWSPVASAFYEVNIGARSASKLVYNPSQRFDPRIDPRVDAALAAGFAAEAASMKQHIEDKINERLQAMKMSE